MNSVQKKFIQKNIKYRNSQELSLDLKIPEKEILDYLKKIWRADKYKKYVNALKENKNESRDSSSTFNAQHTQPNNLLQRFLANDFNVFVFLFFVVMALYVWTLPFDFVSDDIAAIRDNPEIKRLEFLFSAGPLYFFSMLFHFVVANVIGITPWGFRLLNILFHLGSAVMSYLVVKRISKNSFIGFVTGLLFAVHPILTESVTWISGISSSQYAFFTLLSFYFYLEPLKDFRKNYALSLFFFLCAMSSANRAVSVFLIFPLYEIILGNGFRNYKKYLPYIFVGVIFAFVAATKIGYRIDTISNADLSSSDIAGENSLLTYMKIPVSIVTYLVLIIFPKNLSFYQTELTIAKNYFVAIGIIMFVLMLVYIWLLIRFYSARSKLRLLDHDVKTNTNYLLFWGTFFIITLLPVITPLKIAWLVAERYVYLSSLGIFAILAIFLNYLYFKFNKKLVLSILFVIIVALSARTVFRNLVWQNQDTLWLATLKTSPSGYVIHNNMGDYYYRHGDLPKAMDEFSLAIKIRPDYAEAFHNLANTQMEYAKKIASQDKNLATQYKLTAVENYKNALKYNATIYQSDLNLASYYYDAGEYGLSEYHFMEVLKKRPDYQGEIYFWLIQIYLKTSDFDKAAALLEPLLSADPQNKQLLELKKQIEIGVANKDKK